MNDQPSKLASLAAFWWEIKTTVAQIIPYAMMVWLIWMYNGQQQDLMSQHIDALELRISEQTKVLSSIRDTLTQRGLVVPPFGGTS